MTGRDIYLTGRDIYFGKGHNFVTNYEGDEILIMCTNPYYSPVIPQDSPFGLFVQRDQIFQSSGALYFFSCNVVQGSQQIFFWLHKNGKFTRYWV